MMNWLVLFLTGLFIDLGRKNEDNKTMSLVIYYISIMNEKNSIDNKSRGGLDS